MQNLPPDLYFSIRRIGERVNVGTIFDEEMPKMYSDFDKSKIYEQHARRTINLDPDDFHPDVREKVRNEQNLLNKTAELYPDELNFDKETPLSEIEKKKNQRIVKYINQKQFFVDRPGKSDVVRGGRPERLSSEESESLSNMKAEDPDLDYFDDIGKHLYSEHGWGLGDFEDHPTALSRAVAHHNIHCPIVGTVVAGGQTSFEELDPDQSVQRIPIYQMPSPYILHDHMVLFHGKEGNELDHMKDHTSQAVWNHTHAIW
jgi:hypothetical protein